jgi:hypothetical protein
MILTDQGDAVTEFDTLDFEPVRYAPDRIEHLRVCEFRTFLADDLHCHLIGMRLSGIGYQLAK